MIRKDYTPDNRDQIIQDMIATGYTLVEDAKHFDGQYLIFDEPLQPPHSQHIGKVISIDVTKAKPIKVARKWLGVTYNVDCLVSQNVVTIYQAGKLAVNDFVIVSFIDEIPDTTEIELAIVTDKVFKSWT
jgi:hypothetical protein